jgi:hypothetical protein
MEPQLVAPSTPGGTNQGPNKQELFAFKKALLEILSKFGKIHT